MKQTQAQVQSQPIFNNFQNHSKANVMTMQTNNQFPLQTLQTQANPMMQFNQQNQPLQNLMVNSTNKFAQFMASNGNSNFNSNSTQNQQHVIQNEQDKLFYSTQNDLNEEEMKEFNAIEFTLGMIPRNPPTKNFNGRY